MTDPGVSSADQKVAQRRVWRAVIGWGWRAAPGWTVYTAALLVGNAVCTVLYPVGFALIIDAALQHQLAHLVLGMVSVVVLYTVSWALAMFAGTAGSVLSDRVTFFLSARIAEQINAVSGVDHLERPAYLTELDLLQQNLRTLGNGPRQILLVIQVLARTVGIVVILAVIFPPLAVLPLCAIAPVAGERSRSGCGSAPTNASRQTGGSPTTCSRWPPRRARPRNYACSARQPRCATGTGAWPGR